MGDGWGFAGRRHDEEKECSRNGHPELRGPNARVPPQTRSQAAGNDVGARASGLAARALVLCTDGLV